MNQDIARFAVRSAFRSARELHELLALLQDHASTEDYERMRPGIAEAIAAIGMCVTNEVLAGNPEMTEEIETSLDRYGRFL